MRWYEDPKRLQAAVDRHKAGPPSRMVRDRWVRVRCDYSSEAVSDRDGSGVPEALPISPALMVRLHRWHDLFEANDAWDANGNRWTPEHDRAFSDEGLAIAIAMKGELPDWTIVYHDDWRAAAIDTQGVEDRGSYFEYEITAEVERTGERPSAGRAQAGSGSGPTPPTLPP